MPAKAQDCPGKSRRSCFGAIAASVATNPLPGLVPGIRVFVGANFAAEEDVDAHKSVG
jgi:hypothetical protein